MVETRIFIYVLIVLIPIVDAGLSNDIPKGPKSFAWFTIPSGLVKAGYTFDHIEEFCLTKNNNLTNIQALCPNCHSVKTKNFSKYKYIFTSIELEQGAGFMET